MFERGKTRQEGLKGAKKLEEHPVESMNFLQGEVASRSDIGSPSIPQPPEHPQPARPYGLPRWQTKPQNMLDDVMTRWAGPIKTDQDYIAVKDRLKYLEKYQPILKGELRIRCDTAIRLLKDRIEEYETKNIHEFLAKIADFVKKRIETDAQLVEAEDYLSDLVERSGKLAGSYARAANTYISRLREIISNWRERHPEGTKPEEKLTEKKSLVTGRVKGLGLAGAKLPPTPMAEIPEVLRPFWTYVLRGAPLKPTWKHRIDSEYCKIETITPGREWRLGFEDRDEAYGPTPDWDYDEPTLHITRADNELSITIEKYGGWQHSDIYYGETKLWGKVGSLFHYHVGETKTVTIPEGITPPPPPPPPVVETLKKYAPWIIGIAMIGGTIAIVSKKKK